MWDTVDTTSTHLSHDMPCARCGHAGHTYLACSDTCSCKPETTASVKAPRATMLTA
jgi:hypothetical protein